MIKYKDESERLKKEHAALEKSNPGLCMLLQDMAAHVTNLYKKDLIITMIDRTQAEQDELYKNDPKYKIKKFKSPHMFNQALDLRSRGFTQKEIDELVKWLNDTYNKTNSCAWTARAHDIDGDGPQSMHFHIQYQVKK